MSIPPFGCRSSPTRKAPPPLSTSAVTVWLVAVDDASRTGAALRGAALPAHELAAASTSSAPLRTRWTARAALRALLGLELGLAPATLRFELDAFGKPSLAGEPRVEFNLSHSGSVALVALSRGGPVGADVERRKPRARMLAIARRWLGAENALALERTPPSEREAAFYRLWTLHEAFAKAVGQGLALQLADVHHEPGPPWPASVSHPACADADWRYRSLELDGYAAAVVAQGSGWELRPRRISTGELCERLPA